MDLGGFRNACKQHLWVLPKSEAHTAAVVRDGDDALLMSALSLPLVRPPGAAGRGGINEAGEGRKEGAVSGVPDSINQLFLCVARLGAFSYGVKTEGEGD